ncbi:MAG: hypothetical protein ABI397_02520 [Candidatus Saccharimonas sp.]
MVVFAMMLAITPAFVALPAYADSSSALSIAPKKNYVIEPGKSVNDKLVIRNLDSEASLDLTLKVIDFTYNDESGTPKLFLKDTPQTTWSLKSFMTVPENVSIAPGSSKSVDMSVAIPAGQGAGSYYSAIIYSTGASEGGNVGLSASGVTLVFVNVPGKVSEDLKIKQLGVYNKTGSQETSNYKSISSVEPLNVGYTLVNNGNVAESPVGSITMDNLFFGKKIVINDINPAGSLAIRGQTRLFVTCIKTKAQDVDFQGQSTQATACVSPDMWPGLYSISGDFFYGQNGNPTQEITKSVYFWYLPWWFVVLVLVVLAIVIYFAWKIVRYVRSKFDLPGRKRGMRRRKGSRHEE